MYLETASAIKDKHEPAIQAVEKPVHRNPDGQPKMPWGSGSILQFGARPRGHSLDHDEPDSPFCYLYQPWLVEPFHTSAPVFLFLQFSDSRAATRKLRSADRDCGLRISRKRAHYQAQWPSS